MVTVAAPYYDSADGISNKKQLVDGNDWILLALFTNFGGIYHFYQCKKQQSMLYICTTINYKRQKVTYLKDIYIDASLLAEQIQI